MRMSKGYEWGAGVRGVVNVKKGNVGLIWKLEGQNQIKKIPNTSSGYHRKYSYYSTYDYAR